MQLGFCLPGRKAVEGTSAVSPERRNIQLNQLDAYLKKWLFAPQDNSSGIILKIYQAF